MNTLRERLASLSAERRRLFDLLLVSEGISISVDHPTTAAQRRIWFEERLRPESHAWNICAAVQVVGALDRVLLEDCLRRVVARHDALQASFHEVDGAPVQRIGIAKPLGLELLDRSHVPPVERASDAEQRVREITGRRIDLEAGPVMNVVIIDYEPGVECVVVMLVHHIVADGWSMNVLLAETLELYTAAKEGRPQRLSTIRTRSVDRAAWELSDRSSEQHKEAVASWRRRLGDALPLIIPGERRRTGESTFRGSLLMRTLSRDVVESLDNMAVAERASLFMVLLAAFQALCYRRTGQQDVVVGAGVANRPTSELEATIGCFVNLIAVRVDLSGSPTVRGLVGRVRERCLQALEDGGAAFDAVVDALQPIRALTGTSLMRAVIVMQNSPDVPVVLPGLRLTRIVVDPGTTRFDLTIFVTRTSTGLELRVQYATDVLLPAVAEELLEAYVRLLGAWSAGLERSIDELPIEALTGRRSSLLSARPKPVRLGEADLVELTPIDDGWQDGPAVIVPRLGDLDALAWISASRDWLAQQMARRGALILRGFLPPDVEKFRAIVSCHERELIDDNGELPRLGLGDGLYAAVDYPPGEYILWHNENSFYRVAPARLWFLCVQAAREGGATPTVDGRRMLERVGREIVESLRQRGLSYVRTYGDGLGLEWRNAFKTSDRQQVEAHCRALGLGWDWDGHRLRTTSRRPGIVKHPLSGDECWFNQIAHWHPACLPPDARVALDGLDSKRPRHVTFGDGGEIPEEVVAAICEAYTSLEVAVPWRPGDVMVIDNVLASHARRPYIGARQLAIAMAGRIDDGEPRIR